MYTITTFAAVTRKIRCDHGILRSESELKDYNSVHDFSSQISRSSSTENSHEGHHPGYLNTSSNKLCAMTPRILSAFDSDLHRDLEGVLPMTLQT